MCAKGGRPRCNVHSAPHKLVHFAIILIKLDRANCFSKTCHRADSRQLLPNRVLIHTYWTQKLPESLLLTIMVSQHVQSHRKRYVVSQLFVAFFEPMITKHSTIKTGHEFASERLQNTKTKYLLELQK